MEVREPKKKYQCSQCNQVHETHYQAEECCQPEVYDVWECTECGETHDTKEQAVACCPLLPDAPGQVCPSCLRSHAGSAIEQAAIAVAGHCSTCNPLYTPDQQHAIEQLHYQATGEPRRLNA